MGCFMEEITLENVLDRGDANRGYIKESQVRLLKVDAVPDTGAWTLVINEEVRQKLGLEIEGKCHSTLADGKSSTYPLTQAVKVQWKDRFSVHQAVVVTDAKDVLLGALPLEAMDLAVDPVHQTLVGAHGDTASYQLY